MRRRDYELLTDALRSARAAQPCAYNDGVNAAANDIADALKADNPKFDSERFLRDAGVIS